MASCPTSWLSCFLLACLHLLASAESRNRMMQLPVKSVFALSQSSSIPRVIHQSWKTSVVPKGQRKWQQSWKDMHPHWEYNLWTDQMNKELVGTHFRWFLPIYNRFPLEIYRADAARYMYMYKYGGVYADMDFRALKPMDDLLVGSFPQAVVGQLSNDSLWANNFPNAWLASSPEHPFWMYCLMEMSRFSLLVDCEGGASCTRDSAVERTTGPMMLWRAINLYSELGRIGKDPVLRILAPYAVYPLNWRPGQFDKRCLEPKTEEGLTLFRKFFLGSRFMHRMMLFPSNPDVSQTPLLSLQTSRVSIIRNSERQRQSLRAITKGNWHHL